MADIKRASNEVTQFEHVGDGTDTPPAKTEEHSDITQFSPEEQKAIIRRIDWRIMPMVGLLYFISLMDRTQCMYNPPPHSLEG